MRCLRSLTNTASLRRNGQRSSSGSARVAHLQRDRLPGQCLQKNHLHCWGRASKNPFWDSACRVFFFEFENKNSVPTSTDPACTDQMIAALSKLRVARLDEGELMAPLTACKLMSVALLPRLLPLP